MIDQSCANLNGSFSANLPNKKLRVRLERIDIEKLSISALRDLQLRQELNTYIKEKKDRYYKRLKQKKEQTLQNRDVEKKYESNVEGLNGNSAQESIAKNGVPYSDVPSNYWLQLLEESVVMKGNIPPASIICDNNSKEGTHLCDDFKENKGDMSESVVDLASWPLQNSTQYNLQGLDNNQNATGDTQQIQNNFSHYYTKPKENEAYVPENKIELSDTTYVGNGQKLMVMNNVPTSHTLGLEETSTQVPVKHNPRRGVPSTLVSDAGSVFRRRSMFSGSSVSPAMSSTIPERSRRTPASSSSPGFSCPPEVPEVEVSYLSNVIVVLF
jgi:hypothetical protein